MRPLWWVHVGFIGLYGLVMWDRWDAERIGAAFFSSVWVDLTVSLPAVVAFAVLPQALGQRLGSAGMGLARWSVAEVPALVGIVGFLSGAGVVWVMAHFALTWVLLVLSAPRPSRARG